MLSQDIPDLVLKELRSKLYSLNLMAFIVFAGSGLLTGPILLLLRKSGFAAGMIEGLREERLDAQMAEQLVGWLVVLVVCWGVAAIIEGMLLPWIFKNLFEQDHWTPLHFKTLSEADAIFLAPIIKSANGLQLAKVALRSDNGAWRFEYRAWIKYPLMVISAGAVLSALNWLVR